MYIDSGIPTLNLEDLPKDKFKISIDNKTIKNILNKLELNGKKLYKEFSKVKSQRNKKLKSIKRSFLMDWKEGRRIPIDCFKVLCDLSNNKFKDLQKKIKCLNSGYSKKGWNIKFPIKLDKNYFIISEAIRTEGCIMKGKNSVQGIAISNKNIFLIKLIENKLKKLNICEKSFSRRLHIYCYFKKKENIKTVLCKTTNRKLHFNFKNKRLIFTDFLLDFDNIEKEYEIVINNKRIPLKIKTNKHDVIFVDSKLHSTAFVSLQAYNTVFAKFLHHCFDIPHSIGNKKSFIIDFPFNIEKLSKDILKEIINIVVSCEGSVNIHKKARAITIKIGSLNYLKKLQKILSIFGIGSFLWNKSVEKLYILEIRRKNNFLKFNNLIELYTKHKKIKLMKILSSYQKDRFTYFEATKNYLSILQENEPITLKEISKIMNKNYNTIMATFCRLYNEGLINKYGKRYTGKGNTPWIFELTSKGKEYIN